MATKEFNELVLDGTNYSIWASDIKINFASRGILSTIEEPNDGDLPIEHRKLNTALFVLRLYIHKDLKHEYMLETSPHTLWKALKERYDQQKELIWPEANYEWIHLRLQDFKTVAEYNHAVHNICSRLKFCEQEPTEAEKIEKTLSTMLPEDKILTQQYRANNFQKHSLLIHTLTQAERHHELSLKNAQQHPPGSAPLPEVHFNVQNNAENKKGFKGNSSNNPKNLTGKRKRNNNRRKFKGRKKGKGKDKAPQPRSNVNKHCNRCGSDTHVAKDCRIPKYLVLLYQKSLKDKKIF
uniref:Retrotransposon protein, putative, Ty1-copia subclass n=1 Tax=Oryza sativa subsp. japonica TaxID=39947 RepID=Q2QU86_ORYSJ|nr:retrotransposon protein, putative, Ty1-copia subclass [Oryza sativa Japonica Group]